MIVRREFVVRGVVQGVGFRPHVARLANALTLVGTCRNDATCVVIEVQGESEDIETFADRLVSQAPPMARIMSVDARAVAAQQDSDFTIDSSSSAAGVRTLVPPDTAVCADCLTEFNDPTDRRYRHPFITCTNCGPRLTITLDLPYDRPVTTMAGFAMCAACQREYVDPTDRRYHAQPIACHDCGPTLRALGRDGTELASGTDAAKVAIAALCGGAIVAIKGIGGYHLACDAFSCSAPDVLRERKHRPDQPFALMAASLDVARRLVDTGEAEELLTSPERPIVVLPRRVDAPVAGCVAPGLDELGVMLPYAPVHHLLFADQPDGMPGAPEVLVMTSGNVSGEPLCYRDDEAVERLGDIADVFLTHDRPIAVPVEDSVIAWSAQSGSVPMRRSRGYAPLPVDLGQGGTETVLAAGAELKNTVALSSGGQAFVSAHVGDLESLASREAHDLVTKQLVSFHRSTPALVVSDLHPGYASRAWAQKYAASLGVPVFDVQHHHAHLASLAAEHGLLDEPILGIVLDGTGYGCDATIWGGEFLLLGEGGTRAQRVGHLGAIRLPGGDSGVRNPVRTAALALLDAGVELEGTRVGAELGDPERGFLQQSAESGAGVVTTSSTGRLFDVVASVLGVRHRISYEAQAAVELEACARMWRRANPDAAVPALHIDVEDLTGLLRELCASDESPGALAFAFHQSLGRSVATLAMSVAPTGLVGLTGGVFVNRLLLAAASRQVVALGGRVLVHHVVPANDGGLALGQVAVGSRSLHLNKGERPCA